MARGERNAGWSGFFLTFTVFAAILLLLAREGQGEAVSAGARQVLVIYEGLTCWAVPALFMSWGMAALEEGKPSLTGALAGLVLPAFCLLLFWGAAYALAAHLLGGGAVSWSGILGALRSAALGDVYFHLRVLYPLLGLYLVTPVLRAFVRGAGRGDFHWFFLLVFVFNFLLPTLLRLRPSQTVSLYQSYLNIKLVLGYVGYYVLGYYLKEYTLSRPAEYLIYLLGIAGAAVTVGGTAWLSQQRGALAQTFYNYDSPNIALMSTAVFVLFRYLLGVSDERSRRQRFSGVAKVSFGIYLVHVFFLILLRNFGITALSFLASLAAAWLLSKVPFVGKYLT